VASRRLDGPLTLELPLTGEDWHALVVRGPSGLRLDEALLSTG